MIVGYSVDDDVIVASRVLKRSDISISDSIRSSFKTSTTTVLATMVALITLYIMSISSVITQIASFLLIGLVFDFMNTWLFDVTLLRWYAEKKGVKK
jgi:preprotein translocase subunit SecF